MGRWRAGRTGLNRDCQAFRGVLGTKVVVLKPREPEHKGIIERAHDYFERSFLPGRSTVVESIRNQLWLTVVSVAGVMIWVGWSNRHGSDGRDGQAIGRRDRRGVQRRPGPGDDSDPQRRPGRTVRGRNRSGPASPSTTSAIIRPTRGENLNPCPEHGDATTTGPTRSMHEVLVRGRGVEARHLVDAGSGRAPASTARRTARCARGCPGPRRRRASTGRPPVRCGARRASRPSPGVSRP